MRHLAILGSTGSIGTSTLEVVRAHPERLGVKDSNVGGVGIPGHGGMLDRVDSLVFAAPVLYAYVHFVHGFN